ncbi:MAG: mannose-6-phosphate isomerase [Deltaproteobacteria bacterium]|nr:MAG: mannose-6-phosphate isomerase [Deltaproteobacteria bacterium]
MDEYIENYKKIIKEKSTTFLINIRPWGGFEVLADWPSFKVKRIWVKPGHRLSYQKHFKRVEHWIVVEGNGLVTLDGKEIMLKKGDHIDVPKEAAHIIANNGKSMLIFIEIQHGEYFGEDDIIRIEDDYGRK